MRFDPQARLLVVGTLRTEEVDAGHPLTVLLTDLRRAGRLTEIALGPLSESETAALAAEVTGQPLEQEQAASLYRETEGVPLFVIESLRAGLTPAALPPQVEAVLAARLAQLTPPARELAGAAAVIGQAFRVNVPAQASGVGEEALVRGLDEMWRRRIAREHGTEAYEFSHAKSRDVAYAGLGAAHRRLLHRRVAQALEAAHADALDEVSQQIAAHYAQAGERKAAVAWLRRAGEFASRTGFLAEAVACFKRALELLPPGDKRRAELTYQVGTLSEIPCGKEVAWEWLERAWALAQESGDPRSMALTRLGMSRIVSGRGEGREAQHLAEEALTWAKEINEQGLYASVARSDDAGGTHSV